jgi:hypothetical protein
MSFIPVYNALIGNLIVDGVTVKPIFIGQPAGVGVYYGVYQFAATGNTSVYSSQPTKWLGAPPAFPAVYIGTTYSLFWMGI